MEQITFVPYGKRYKYPHMGPEDVAIWERFMLANPVIFEQCAYDVPVGSLPEFSTEVSPETGGKADRLYKKKIDVVALVKEVLYIIEVKPSAGAGAVGQVKNYRMLYKRDYNPKQAVTMAIITDRITPDLELFAQEERVQLFVA